MGPELKILRLYNTTGNMREETMTKLYIQRKIQGPILQYLFVRASFLLSAIVAMGNDWQNIRPHILHITPMVRNTGLKNASKQ
jgi:hypothetical protein